MRIVQTYTAVSAPFGSRTINVSFEDGSRSTIAVPPWVQGAQATRKWIEDMAGKKVRSWQDAIAGGSGK
jgi:hypothetical protein